MATLTDDTFRDAWGYQCPPDCKHCLARIYDREWGVALQTLAHNLAIGAALCLAWHLGAAPGLISKHNRWWSPGCGRAVVW